MKTVANKPAPHGTATVQPASARTAQGKRAVKHENTRQSLESPYSRRFADSGISGKKTGVKTSSKVKPKSDDQNVATVSAGLKSADKIVATLRSLEAQLRDPLISSAAYKLIAKSVTSYSKALLSAPLEPTPERNFISGPIHFIGTYKTWFSNEKDPNFFSFFYKSLDDVAWEKAWKSFYKFAVQELGILLSIGEAILKEPDDDRFFDASGKEKRQMGKREEFLEDQAKQTPSYYLEHGIAKPHEWFAEVTGSETAGVIGRGASRLAFVIDAALTGYEIYQANIEGPSLHAAAVETTARIMGRAFNMSRGINMMRGQGGEFIPHQDATSEVRVAQNPLDRTPLPQISDRRLAYDLVANRVYEMMMSVLAPKHLMSASAFKEFRDARIGNAGNIVDNAGGFIIDQSEKFGGKVGLLRESKAGGTKSYVAEIGNMNAKEKKQGAQVIPCRFPKSLGSGRILRRKEDADSGHYDYPPKVPSKASEVKMGVWAALHNPFYLPMRSMVSDAKCLLEMYAVLMATSGSAGYNAVRRFAAGTGGKETLDNTKWLGALALKAPSFLATLMEVKAKIEAQLATQAATGPLNPCAFSKLSPMPQTHFHLGGPDPLPLQAVIGGTQGEDLQMTGFAGDIQARTYSADLRFLIRDDFGVDETDLYFFGLIPFWILQHERSPTLYKPFVNELDLTVNLNGKF